MNDKVRMGALASKDQVTEVRERVAQITATGEIIFGDPQKVDLIGADSEKGAFLSPILMLEKHPHKNTLVHEVEAFGPVSTLMPYTDIHDAVDLAKMGKGSLVCSITTADDRIAREFTINAASHHGRILILNRVRAGVETVRRFQIARCMPLRENKV